MFVVYHKETTKFLRTMKNGYWQSANMFEREQDAKACLTRQSKKTKGPNANLNVSDYAIAEAKHFYQNIEKKEMRRGIVGSEGKDFEVGVNTEWTSGPWSETYWCS